MTASTLPPPVPPPDRPTPTPMVELENVTKSYGPFTAVRDLSFSVKPGEILGFLGPNGAGKTTTMRVLTGFFPPTSGEARVAGYDIVEHAIEAGAVDAGKPQLVVGALDFLVLEFGLGDRGLERDVPQRRRFDLVRLVGGQVVEDGELADPPTVVVDGFVRAGPVD